MLTLSRPHRQALATLAVFAFLVVPTGYVGWTCWRVQQPEHRHEVERDLSRQLGLEVTIGSLRYPQPRLMAFRQVSVRVPGLAQGNAARRARRRGPSARPSRGAAVDHRGRRAEAPRG